MNWKNILLMLLAGLIFGGVAIATTLEWENPINLGFDATHDMHLVGGPDGYFHMLFAQSDSKSFYYFKETETGPFSEVVETYTDIGFMFSSLSFWGNIPTGVYRHKLDENLQFNTRFGSSWSAPTEVPGTSECYAVAAAFEPTGIIHIAWVHSYGGISNLMHSKNAGPDWEHRMVHAVGDSTFTRQIDMKLDSHQIPHFVWYNTVTDEISYAVQNGAAYEPEVIDSTDYCRYLELDFIDPDLPVVGYAKGSSTDILSVHYALRFADSWTGNTVLDGVEIIDVDMAINRAESITTTQWYFIVALSTGFHYVYPGAGTWEINRIDELSSISSNAGISADWNVVTESVGVAICDFDSGDLHFIKASPVAPGPTPTPGSCTELGCTVDMPSSLYRAGDPCYCQIFLCNMGPKTYVNLPVFVLLEVFDTFYFAPAFNDYDHYTVSSFPAGPMTLEVLPPFSWPADVGAASGIHFYAAMTNREVTELIGEYDMFTFGWE